MAKLELDFGDKIVEEFAQNTLLSLCEYILEVGMDKALRRATLGRNDDELRLYPHIKAALKGNNEVQNG